ncbi:MAG: S-adenosylmethionine:tRNA ribosyltransferase-isomerase [Prevotella sp.]|nr:S-adenosylmethionine:tRNA ribosyltransferase-isomerase [Prevotella sp.]
MKLSQFDYNLPSAQVALYPHSIERTVTNDNGEETTFSLKRPDECRMVVVHKKSQKIELRDTLLDVFDYFDEGDMFIFNNTKVLPARLYGTKEKTDAKIEVFLLRELNEEMRLWDVLVEPARKIRIGNKLFFNEEGTIVAEVIDNTTSRGRTLRFLYDCPHDVFKERIFSLGEAPLPRYVIDHKGKDGKLDRPVTEEDFDDFQNVFAEIEGAVTAPSTGLHFTRQMMKRLDIHGIKTAFITLHCGLGIFHPIEVEDLSKHKADSEEMHVTEETCDKVNTVKKNGHRVCCVGASVLKATETVVGTDGFIKPFDGWTNKFIFPPYNYGLADSCIVNLYHPKSPMVMATAAFGGYDIVMDAYKKAMKAGFRVGCFGDVMLIVND